MAIAWKGAKGKARMQISNLTFGGTFLSSQEMAKGVIPKVINVGDPLGEAHVS